MLMGVAHRSVSHRERTISYMMPWNMTIRPKQNVAFYSERILWRPGYIPVSEHLDRLHCLQRVSGDGGTCEIEGPVTLGTGAKRHREITTTLFSRRLQSADRGVGIHGCGMRLSAPVGFCRYPGRVANMFVVVRLARTYAR